MPAGGGALSATRFCISIDGAQVGGFDELFVSVDGASPPRSVQGHELAHVVQQGQARPHRRKWPDITLKRGYISQSAEVGLRAAAGKRVTIHAATLPGVRLTLLAAKVQRSRGRANGNAIAIEELVLSHEGFG